MGPENIRFGGGSPVTVLHPIVAVAMVLAIILIFYLPRKYVMIPALLVLFLTPKGQQLVLVGLHFNVSRIIIMAGVARWWFSRKKAPFAGGFNFMDRVCIAFFLTYWLTATLLFMQSQATIKNTGDLLDALGGYIMVRFMIYDREDILRAIKLFVAIAAINAASMIREQRDGMNVFGLLGGLPPEDMRDGKYRSQGAFAVFITAGTFGATFVPLLVWLWSQAKCRMLAVLGLVSATIMSVTCQASTTVIAYASGVMALCLWPFRKWMRLLRWGIVAMLVGLHIAMNGPVWSLLEHIDLTGSSSSYHRYMLIDNFVRHFQDWWLLGATDYHTWGWMMWDTSNQYVAYAFNGGLATFALFIAILSRGFGRLGTARKTVEGNLEREWFLWCLGSSLFAHLVSYFGIGYFDQMQIAWFSLLAFISIAVAETTDVTAPAVEEATTPDYEIQAANS